MSSWSIWFPRYTRRWQCLVTLPVRTWIIYFSCLVSCIPQSVCEWGSWATAAYPKWLHQSAKSRALSSMLSNCLYRTSYTSESFTITMCFAKELDTINSSSYIQSCERQQFRQHEHSHAFTFVSLDSVTRFDLFSIPATRNDRELLIESKTSALSLERLSNVAQRSI